MVSKRFTDEGFTGLEAAIVLIAFVVVAAVFSYVVLGAGFFTTQKSQQVVHTGVTQASSTLQVVGNVYGTAIPADVTGGVIDAVNFSIGLAPGGTPVDISQLTVVVSNTTFVDSLSYIGSPNAKTAATAGTWSIYQIRNIVGTSPTLLQSGEEFDIMVAPNHLLPINSQFTIELRPVTGAALGITRTVPAAINPLNVLY